jgi:hypothetical protein
MLDEYRQIVQGWLRERNQKGINPTDVDLYINRARREVAMRSQSIRLIAPISGAVTKIQVTNPGSGYTDPTVTISTPDFPRGQGPTPAGLQATAICQQIGGQISMVSLTQGGDGYFMPQATISDPTGSGAVLECFTTPIMAVQQAQEVIQFSQIPLQQFPGVRAVFYVQSISMLYDNYRFSLAVFPFSIYQAVIRRYAQQYQFVPVVGAQYGSGVAGSLYLYPVPQSLYQVELDCYCIPDNLTDNSDIEVIPLPWTDCVPYFATHLALHEKGDLNAARYYFDLHDSMVHRYSAWARPGRITNPYGRAGG